jgi:branched-chain amino acid transport system substrate-binding protein
MTPRWIAILFGALLASAAGAAPAGNTNVVRDLAARVGPIVGSALACTDIARPRIQAIVEKFAAVIKEASSKEAERDDLTQLFNRSIADGRNAVTAGKMDCRLTERQLADLERSIAGPAPSLSSAAAATSTAPVPSGPPVRGVTDTEIRFAIAAPFSGSAKELGRQVKLGIDTAFNRTNDAGGVNGRMLRLMAADDGYEPTRTLDAMKQLYEKDQVFGFIGNVGTPTAAVRCPMCSSGGRRFSAPSPAPTSCATIRPIAMYSIIVRATRRKPMPSCTI